MSEYSQILGDAVKRARGKSGLTQSEVAAQAGIDVRTVLNIENNKGNPKLEVLYPLIRTLNMDPREIFYPELTRDSVAITRIQQLLCDCSDEELETLMPVVTAVLTALRDKNAQVMK